MTSAISVVLAAISVDICLTAVSSSANCASVAFVVLRTEVKADSNSMLDFTATAPSAATAVDAVAVRSCPSWLMASLDFVHFLLNDSMLLPTSVHLDFAAVKSLLQVLISDWGNS